MTKEEKRLGILWVLLNISTEYNGNNKQICSVMDDIEKYCPDAVKMWQKQFELTCNGKPILRWDKGVKED